MQFTDNQGEVWGDYQALKQKTNISAKTCANWVAENIFEANVHYAKADNSGKIFYNIKLCEKVHRQRLQAHKNNLAAGKYVKRKGSEKRQVNVMLTPHEIAGLQTLQGSGDYERTEELKCGEIVLRSESKPMSLSAIATELLRRALIEEVTKTHEKHTKLVTPASING